MSIPRVSPAQLATIDRVPVANANAWQPAESARDCSRGDTIVRRHDKRPAPSLSDAAASVTAALPWEHRHDPGNVMGGNVLVTSPEQGAAIRRNQHEIRVVHGQPLDFPSQRLDMIESQQPNIKGQTHIITRHVEKSVDENVALLTTKPGQNAAGGFTDLASAQSAVDTTIAAGQRTIKGFLTDKHRLMIELPRVELGKNVGAITTRDDMKNGRPALHEAHSASVVLIKDPSFDCGYRVYTAYPVLTEPSSHQRDGHRHRA